MILDRTVFRSFLNPFPSLDVSLRITFPWIGLREVYEIIQGVYIVWILNQELQPILDEMFEFGLEARSFVCRVPFIPLFDA